MNIQDYFVVPIVDLGQKEARYAGIYVPEPELDVQKTGITDQFLENAEVYHARYSASDHWLGMFNRIFTSVQKPGGERLRILDIGTGSGLNTIVPCLKLFPDCSIVGTDLSPQLLAILRSYVTAESLDDQVYCVCTDAMRNFFKPGSFDVVVGGSILHHLVDPVAALAAAKRALKPGGIAVFIEPFEGYSVIRAAFTLILARAELEGSVSESAKAFMVAMCRDIEVRAGSDKSSPMFQYMDDKWLFTRTYLQRASREAGFDSIDVVPMFDPDRQYRRGATGLLAMGGIDAERDLPAWALDCFDLFDRSFSSDLKAEATLESGIVLRRSF
ncbi:class I SAM-dependent methyltransferase [uncultured Enterovirga sp.]|uniref:class I SAM-dependent methyltransferase n=1 Tax=uncultured Enterovirga sp. TaxID=2026352 RepID=UPI0035C9DCAA